jgi:Tol biopolymer transport system component
LRYSQQTGLTDLIHTNAVVPLTSFENIHNLDMTPDGRFITFAANVTGNSGTNTAIYLWDAQTGTNTPVSVNLSNTLPATALCDSPVLSANGQCVAFLSSATNLTANSLAGTFHLYLRNMQAGTTWLVDADTNGVGSGVDSTTVPSLSADGQSVAFESVQRNLVPNDNNGDYDAFLASPFAGATELISTHHPALPGGGPTIIWPAVSGQSYRVLFQGDLGDTNWQDVTGTVTIIGKHGYVTDFAPAPARRFYRGVAN